MKTKKYRELVELKGLLRQKKMTYINLCKAIGICINALCDKLNGFSVFDLMEATKIINVLEIPTDKINYYFF